MVALITAAASHSELTCPEISGINAAGRMLYFQAIA